MTENTTEMPVEDAIATVWDLAEAIDICMFVTWDGERQRARPLSARPDRDAELIHFLTDVHGAKDEQIERFPTVTLAFSDVRAHDYLVITGIARISDDRDTIARLWTPVDKAWWDSPDDPSIRVITVTPEDAELWKGPNRISAGARMLAAVLTGAKPSFGENQKVDQL